MNLDSTQRLDFHQRLKLLEEDQESELEKLKSSNLIGIRDGLLDLYDIEIDGTSINGRIDALFYVHPHLNSKGLKCFTS